MFRGAKGHLSQGVRWNEGCEMFVFECKALNVRQLRKCAENGVFRPNISVAEKKRVVFGSSVKCVDACRVERIALT